MKRLGVLVFFVSFAYAVSPEATASNYPGATPSAAMLYAGDPGGTTWHGILDVVNAEGAATEVWWYFLPNGNLKEVFADANTTHVAHGSWKFQGNALVATFAGGYEVTLVRKGDTMEGGTTKLSARGQTRYLYEVRKQPKK